MSGLWSCPRLPWALAAAIANALATAITCALTTAITDALTATIANAPTGLNPAADQPTAQQTEIADVVRRVLADLDLPGALVAPTIAALVLGRPWIAGPLAARDELTQLRHTIDTLRLRHQPTPIRAGHDHLVCAYDRREWPCPDGEALWA